MIRRAMVLAAGRGVRLRPLTDTIPKPMVTVAGRPLIEHTLLRIAAMGINDVVINAHYLADKLMDHVGDGRAYGVSVAWSKEEELMNTGGGLRKALPLLGEEPILAVNGDILWVGEFKEALSALFDEGRMDALLALIPNPPGKGGDFRLLPDGRIERAIGAPDSVTYSGIQILSPKALAPFPVEPFSLNRLYDDAMAAGRLFGWMFDGFWTDIGTPEGLIRSGEAAGRG